MKFNTHVISAATILLLGLGSTWAATLYEIGSLKDMGPGFYPLILGITLILIGILLFFDSRAALEQSAKDVAAQDELQTNTRRPYAAVYIVLGLIAFIVLGRYGGLIPATFALVAIAALADTKSSLKNILILALLTSLGCGVVFNLLIDIQFPLFRWG